MKIEASFSGCSCGCTPYEEAIFEGEAPDIYIAIASWAMDFLLYGSNPFRKLCIPDESEDYCRKAIEIDKQIDELQQKLKGIECKKNACLNQKKAYKDASVLLGTSIPQEILDKMAKLNEEVIPLAEQIKDLNAEISLLKQKRILIFAYTNATRIEREIE